MKSKCINIHDQRSHTYRLTDDYDGMRAVVKTFSILMDSHQKHPEAKSLGPNGEPCQSDTQGLLRRSHVFANEQLVPIGKESDRHWEEGDDLSLLEFSSVQYKQKGYAIADEHELSRIAKVPKRELMRRGINQHTLEKICKREPVRATKLGLCLKVLEGIEIRTDSAKLPSQ